MRSSSLQQQHRNRDVAAAGPASASSSLSLSLSLSLHAGTAVLLAPYNRLQARLFESLISHSGPPRPAESLN